MSHARRTSSSLIKPGQGCWTEANTPTRAAPEWAWRCVKGAPKPDISTPARHSSASCSAAKAVAYTDPDRAAGQAGRAHGGRWASTGLGIADEVRAKAKLGRGTPVAEISWCSGEADIAIQQMPELAAREGQRRYVGPLPGDLQNVTMYRRRHPIGLERRPDAAKALIRIPQTPEAASRVRRKRRSNRRPRRPRPS